MTVEEVDPTPWQTSCVAGNAGGFLRVGRAMDLRAERSWTSRVTCLSAGGQRVSLGVGQARDVRVAI